MRGAPHSAVGPLRSGATSARRLRDWLFSARRIFFRPRADRTNALPWRCRSSRWRVATEFVESWSGRGAERGGHGTISDFMKTALSAARATEVLGLLMIGEGVVGAMWPRRYSSFWKIG